MLFTVAIRLDSVLRIIGSTWCRVTLTFIHGESFRKYQWPTGRAVQTCLSSGSLTDFPFEKHLQALHVNFPSFSGPKFSPTKVKFIRPGHPAHSQRLARASRCSWTNHPRQSQSSHPGPKNKTTLDALRKPAYVRGIWNLSIHWLKENVATVLIH